MRAIRSVHPTPRHRRGIKFQLIVEKAIVITKAKGKIAVGISDRMAIRIVGNRIFFTHFDQNVMHRHRTATDIEIAGGVGWRSPRGQRASHIKTARWYIWAKRGGRFG